MSSTVSHPTESVKETPLFSRPELESFQHDDAVAGRRICTILTTLFTISAILTSTVSLWMLSRALN